MEIRRPIGRQMQEISQTTYVELISVSSNSTDDIIYPATDVGSALNALAFGRRMRYTKRFPTSTNSNSVATTQAVSYRLGARKNNGQQNSIITPSKKIIEPQVGYKKYTAGIRKSNVSTCPPADCMIDVVFSIDESGSMGDEHEAVANAVAKIASLLTDLSSSVRFAMGNFGSAHSYRKADRIPLTGRGCTEHELINFINTARSLPIDGRHEPWHLRLADFANNADGHWEWRRDVEKLVIVITDEPPNEGTWTKHCYDIAVENARLLGVHGIRLVIIYTSNYKFPGMSPYVAIANIIRANGLGKGVVNPARDQIVNMITGYLLAICGQYVAPGIECRGGINKIINSKFDTGIEGWLDTTIYASRKLEWDSTKQAMRLSGSTEQTVGGMDSNNSIILHFAAHVEDPNAVKSVVGATIPIDFDVLEFSDWRTRTNCSGWSSYNIEQIGNEYEQKITCIKNNPAVSVNDDVYIAFYTDQILYFSATDNSARPLIADSGLYDLYVSSASNRMVYSSSNGIFLYSIFSDAGGIKLNPYSISNIRQLCMDDNLESVIFVQETGDREYSMLKIDDIYSSRTITDLSIRISNNGTSQDIDVDEEHGHIYVAMSGPDASDAEILRFSYNDSTPVKVWTTHQLNGDTSPSDENSINGVTSIHIVKSRSDGSEIELFVITKSKVVKLTVDTATGSVLDSDKIVDMGGILFGYVDEIGACILLSNNDGIIHTFNFDGIELNKTYPNMPGNAIIGRQAISGRCFKYGGVISRIISDVTPGDILSFSVDVGDYEDADIVISLDDGDNVLDQSTYSPGVTTLSALNEFKAINGPSRFVSDISKFVIGGTQISSDQINYIVPVIFTPTMSFGTGTFISERHVITAAHVVYHKSGDTYVLADPSDIMVVLKHDKPNDEQIRIKCKRIFVYPKFDANDMKLNTDDAHDVAILELESEVQGLQYPTIANDGWRDGGPLPSVGDTIYIFGFGPTSPTSPPSGLAYGTTTIDDMTDRLIRWRYDEGEQTTFYGDSGGPIMTRMDSGDFCLCAVVSGGEVTQLEDGTIVPASGGISFNTYLSSYIDWIYGIVHGPLVKASVSSNKPIIATIRVIPHDSVGTVSLKSALICTQKTEKIGILKCRLLDGDTRNELAMTEIRSTDLVPYNDVKTFSINTKVPASGSVVVSFDAQDGNDVDFILDDIVLCYYEIDDCKGGSTNAISNPNFLTGVDGWLSYTYDQLPDTCWDREANALILDMSAYNIAITIVGRDLYAGSQMVVDFEVSSMLPEIDQISVACSIRDYHTGHVLAAATRLRSSFSSFPERMQLTFVVPDSEKVEIELSTGYGSYGYGGVVRIRNVLLCSAANICDKNYDRIEYDDFEDNKCAWSGGTHNTSDGNIILADGEQIRKTYTAIPYPRSIILSTNNISGGEFVVEFYSGDIIDQQVANATSGLKRFNSYTYDDTLTIVIKNISGSELILDDILLCCEQAGKCDGTMTDIGMRVSISGTPRHPINIFAAHTVIATRDDLSSVLTHYNNVSLGGYGTSSIINKFNSGVCTYPAIATTGSCIMTSDADMLLALRRYVSYGDTIDGTTYDISDCRWIQFMVGTEEIKPGYFEFKLPDVSDKVVESIKVLLLMNVVKNALDPSPTYDGPTTCTPSEADKIDIALLFKSGTSRFKLVRSINIEDLYVDLVDEEIGDWYSSPSKGIAGNKAQWVSVEFPIDLIGGGGLNQCSNIEVPSAEGSGEIKFGEFRFESSGVAVDPCEAIVEITSIGQSNNVNEVQSIVIGSATGGAFDIEFSHDGQTDSTTVNYGASASDLKMALASLSTVGDINNVDVTGSGTDADPYIVTFKNDLGGTDVELLKIDTKGLVGSMNAYVKTEYDGTSDEWQMVAKRSDDVATPFSISFNGAQTPQLPHNASLNQVQSALESLSSIGSDNIMVTGGAVHRDAEYSGPWYVAFINDLGGQNVAALEVEPSSDYSVTTLWNGGTDGGKNDTQFIHVCADGGTFKLRIYDPDGTDPLMITTIQDGSTDTTQNAVNEIQWVMPTIDYEQIVYSIKRSGTVDGGTFNLHINGVDAQNIPYDITPYDLHELFRPGLRPAVFSARSGNDWDKPISETGSIELGFLGVGRYDIHTVNIDSTNLTGGGTYDIDIQFIPGGVELWNIGGNFALSFDGKTTDLIDISSQVSDVQAKIDATFGTGNITVIDYYDGVVVVEFKGIYAGVNTDQMQITKLPTGANGQVGGVSRVGSGQAVTNEIQSIEINGTPTGGTFTLTLGGETTPPIPYNASTDDVKSAIITLQQFGAGDINVTKSDDKWLVEFTGNYAGTDVPQMTGDGSGLLGASGMYADTRDLEYDIIADQLQSAIVDAADFLDVTDVAVQRVTNDTENNVYEWRVIFGGKHAQKDFAQIEIDASNLAGAPATVTEVTKGSGNNTIQHMVIKLAAAGQFKLAVTVNGVEMITSPILWNTTASGLEEILSALPAFAGIEGAVKVTDLGDSPDPDVISQFEIEFDSRFGQIPPMYSPDAIESLLCDPLRLRPVDPCPYEYRVPQQDALSDITCQSGPRLSKPGEPDTEQEVVCCSLESDIISANGIKIERDLFDPNMQGGVTIRDLALLKRINTASYTPYIRDFNGTTLTMVNYDMEVHTGQSVVLIESNIGVNYDYIVQRIKDNEILPSRM